MYYYAWMHFYADRVSLSQTSVCVDQYAYCTIPDYPLQWGQTSLNWSVEENAGVSANIHPNPTNGIVTIYGDNLTQVEVANILGQKIISSTCSGTSCTIDISEQPAGIYLFSITDDKGKTYTEKVVRH